MASDGYVYQSQRDVRPGPRCGYEPDLLRGLHLCRQKLPDHEVASLGAWRLSVVLQACVTGPFPSLHLSVKGIGFRSIRWDELVLLRDGISPKAARRRNFETEVSTAGKNDGTMAKSFAKSQLYR